MNIFSISPSDKALIKQDLQRIRAFSWGDKLRLVWAVPFLAAVIVCESALSFGISLARRLGLSRKRQAPNKH